MARRCPSCRFEFNRAPDGGSGTLGRRYFECPNCTTKLRQDKASSRLKGIGGLIALTGIILFEGDWDLPAAWLSAWWVFVAVGAVVILIGARRKRWELFE